MSSLPPYSTYRTDNKQLMFPQATSHGNILTFTPPGFKQSLNVKFPDSRLAVCEKCKKNFKTRDMCRVRNTHTSPPWTTAYICISLDDSCTDEDGKFTDKPLTVRMVQWQPFCVKKPFGPKTPVCAACKKTNRTRNFCRERHTHRHLPWCTVYVLLSALDTADPSTVVAGASKPVDDESSAHKDDDSVDDAQAGKKVGAVSPGTSNQDEASVAGSKTSESLDGIQENIKPLGWTKSSDEESDDINDIPESRTFLAKVSSASTTIHWLELAEYENDPAAPALSHGDPAYGVAPSDPAQQPNYYAHARFTGQQHMSQQQYYLNMQQHYPHHYAAAQQAAWQDHYRRHPPHAQMPHPGGPGQTPPAAVSPREGSPAAAPVTAGEAAAQRQKRDRQDEEGQPPSPSGQGPGGQQQHQQYMLYQQMYRAQIPQAHAPYSHRTGQSTETGHGTLLSSDQQYNGPQTPVGNGKSTGETDNKRQRMV